MYVYTHKHIHICVNRACVRVYAIYEKHKLLDDSYQLTRQCHSASGDESATQIRCQEAPGGFSLSRRWKYSLIDISRLTEQFADSL